jgi:AraC-like DNA-binding protein
VVSSEVKNIYKSENLNSFFDEQLIHALIPADELFLNLLMEYTEDNWREPNLRVDDFGKHLGYSKSQLYRKMISLTGKSPNALIKEYRLDQALTLFNKQKGNISEIAFETGFNSPAYFSKCFLEKYGILPSDYTRKSSNIA